jgi:hypothetical protein
LPESSPGAGNQEIAAEYSKKLEQLQELMKLVNKIDQDQKLLQQLKNGPMDLYQLKGYLGERLAILAEQKNIDLSLIDGNQDIIVGVIIGKLVEIMGKNAVTFNLDGSYWIRSGVRYPSGAIKAEFRSDTNSLVIGLQGQDLQGQDAPHLEEFELTRELLKKIEVDNMDGSPDPESNQNKLERLLTTITNITHDFTAIREFIADEQPDLNKLIDYIWKKLQKSNTLDSLDRDFMQENGTQIMDKVLESLPVVMERFNITIDPSSEENTENAQGPQTFQAGEVAVSFDSDKRKFVLRPSDSSRDAKEIQVNQTSLSRVRLHFSESANSTSSALPESSDNPPDGRSEEDNLPDHEESRSSEGGDIQSTSGPGLGDDESDQSQDPTQPNLENLDQVLGDGERVPESSSNPGLTPHRDPEGASEGNPSGTGSTSTGDVPPDARNGNDLRRSEEGNAGNKREIKILGLEKAFIGLVALLAAASVATLSVYHNMSRATPSLGNGSGDQPTPTPTLSQNNLSPNNPQNRSLEKEDLGQGLVELGVFPLNKLTAHPEGAKAYGSSPIPNPEGRYIVLQYLSSLQENTTVDQTSQKLAKKWGLPYGGREYMARLAKEQILIQRIGQGGRVTVFYDLNKAGELLK